jgi:hypothetical protein
VEAVFSAAALPWALAQQASGRAEKRELSWLWRASLKSRDTAAKELASKRAELWQQHLELRRSSPTSMVMADLATPRPTHLLMRGEYQCARSGSEAGALEELLVPWPPVRRGTASALRNGSPGRITRSPRAWW